MESVIQSYFIYNTLDYYKHKEAKYKIKGLVAAVQIK